MINFSDNVTDPKIKCAILAKIQDFNKKSYSSTEMNIEINKFRLEHGENAVQELVQCYEQFVLGMIKKTAIIG
jgi:hypothetical protein